MTTGLIVIAVYLVRQHLGPGLLSLLLVDELHEDPLVLEHITLGLQVKFVVQVAVNLLGLPEQNIIEKTFLFEVTHTFQHVLVIITMKGFRRKLPIYHHVKTLILTLQHTCIS